MSRMWSKARDEDGARDVKQYEMFPVALGPVRRQAFELKNRRPSTDCGRENYGYLLQFYDARAELLRMDRYRKMRDDP